MIGGLERFLLYNLLASLAAGLIAWAAVMLALRLLRARSAFLHTSFLALPLVKSLLVLGGIGLVFPWPVDWFLSLYRRAVPAQNVLPLVLLWFGLSLAVYYFLNWRAHTAMMRDARPPDGIEEQRLQAALERVITTYRESPCCQAGESICCISDQIPDRPLLLVSGTLRSPAALTRGGAPAVIFPSALISELDDTELALALAHELNHFALRKPAFKSSGVVWAMTLASPVAFLLAGYLHHEEEKACDDLAVTILGDREIFAGMLLKCYQFARQQQQSRRLRFLPLPPQLLGYKTFLTERVERQLGPVHPAAPAPGFPLAGYLLWSALLYVLFFAHFAS